MFFYNRADCFFVIKEFLLSGNSQIFPSLYFYNSINLIIVFEWNSSFIRQNYKRFVQSLLQVCFILFLWGCYLFLRLHAATTSLPFFLILIWEIASSPISYFAFASQVLDDGVTLYESHSLFDQENHGFILRLQIMRSF